MTSKNSFFSPIVSLDVYSVPRNLFSFPCHTRLKDISNRHRRLTFNELNTFIALMFHTKKIRQHQNNSKTNRLFAIISWLYCLLVSSPFNTSSKDIEGKKIISLDHYFSWHSPVCLLKETVSMMNEAETWKTEGNFIRLTWLFPLFFPFDSQNHASLVFIFLVVSPCLLLKETVVITMRKETERRRSV